MVYEAFNWQHGVFLGASVSSETTAAAAGEVGKLRHDPFAMLPFCGYHMGDYFEHWINMGRRTSSQQLPRIFAVNWFRKDAQGAYMWPGFGENIRVLKWIFERCESCEGGGEGEGLEGKGASVGGAVESPIGYLPSREAISLDGLPLSASKLQQLLDVDRAGWKAHYEELRQYFTLFAPRFPKELSDQLESLAKRL